MQPYQREFIEFSLAAKALRFGRFELKSGRISPYFFNTGAFDTGAGLSRLGGYYAAAIVARDIEFDMLFGPAYKGIPLASAIAIALHHDHGRDVPVCFNRKERKDHGEGGDTLGSRLAGRVLIVDDVISAGTSINASIAIIERAGAHAGGVMIALDRQERGHAALSAAQEVEREHGIYLASIVGLADVVTYLREHDHDQTEVAAIETYLAEYGV